MLTQFSQLAAGQPMPAHERLRTPLRAAARGLRAAARACAIADGWLAAKLPDAAPGWAATGVWGGRPSWRAAPVCPAADQILLNASTPHPRSTGTRPPPVTFPRFGVSLAVTSSRTQPM